MAEITTLSTLVKGSSTTNDYLVVANSSTKAAKKFQINTLYPAMATSGDGGENLYVSVTSQNQLNFKGLKSGDTGLLTVATDSNNLVLTVLEAGIDLSLCNNATSGFVTGVDFTGTVTGECAVSNGGTGLSTISKGAIFYASADNEISSTAAASNNADILVYNSTTGVPAWAAIDAGDNLTLDRSVAGVLTLDATLTALAANLDTGSYNIDLNTNYISDDGSDRGLYVHTNGKVVLNDSGSTLTTGDATGQLNIQGTTTTAIKIGNSGAYQANYDITGTNSASGTDGANLRIFAATAGGGDKTGGDLLLYAGTGTGSGAGGALTLTAGDAASGTPGSASVVTYTTGGAATTALTVDSAQDVTVNAGSLIITGAAEGIVHTNSGTVTQATDHTTGVTINTTSGVITLAAVALAATTNAEFTVTNSTVQADSVILVTMQDENTVDNKQLACAIHTIAGGSFKISIVNPHSATSTSATASKIHFLVINNSV
jgi:hypothetical protein